MNRHAEYMPVQRAVSGRVKEAIKRRKRVTYCDTGDTSDSGCPNYTTPIF